MFDIERNHKIHINSSRSMIKELKTWLHLSSYFVKLDINNCFCSKNIKEMADWLVRFGEKEIK